MLDAPDDQRAVAALRRYYGTDGQSSKFTGGLFDTWDSNGTRSVDRDRFTADDLVAVSFLSVHMAASAAILLLDTRASEFSNLLTALGDDRDLAEESEPWADDWPGWVLHGELLQLPDVGPTTASKLVARKRPRLRPIFDSVVAEVIGSQNVWEPLRALLSTDPELQRRLLQLRDDAGLSDQISALRVFDVVAWMEGKFGLG